jgi:hypothetical protein
MGGSSAFASSISSVMSAYGHARHEGALFAACARVLVCGPICALVLNPGGGLRGNDERERSTTAKR